MNGIAGEVYTPGSTEGTDKMMDVADKDQERMVGMLEKLFSSAHNKAVFGEPVTKGEYTVITACEIASGGGWGFGRGFGPTPAPKGAEGEQATTPGGMSFGGGGGGGGGSSARPVAAIVIGPNGVDVKPVIDATKLAIAIVTAWAAMLGSLRKMGRKGRR